MSESLNKNSFHLEEGCLPKGGCLSGGCLPRGVSGQSATSLPMNRMTDACENITLPQLRCGRQKSSRSKKMEFLQRVEYSNEIIKLNNKLCWVRLNKELITTFPCSSLSTCENGNGNLPSDVAIFSFPQELPAVRGPPRLNDNKINIRISLYKTINSFLNLDKTRY